MEARPQALLLLTCCLHSTLVVIIQNDEVRVILKSLIDSRLNYKRSTMLASCTYNGIAN